LAAYSNTSNWIKAYDDSNISDPVMDPQQDNAQHSFDPTTVSCAPVGGVTQCTFTLGNREMITPQVYSNPNNIVCFKMETQGTYFLSDAGGLTTGNNVGFNDVYWYDSGRGALRNIHHIFVTYSALKRRPSIPAMNGQAPCFASWAGGPQIGQPNDPLLTGIVLDHFMSEGAADQTTEIFFEDPNEPAGGSVVSNYTVHGGFGGPFTFDNACGMTMDWSSGPHGVPLNQTMQNCSWTTDSTTPALKNPVLNGMPAYNGCVAYYGTTVGCPTQNDLFPNFNQ